MTEVSAEPDIMGDFRCEIEAFYRRDEVVEIEEKNFVLKTFLTDMVKSEILLNHVV